MSIGQDYLTKMNCLSVEDGLSNRFVRSIIQDYKGFLWIATNYGLNRYDGKQFKVFSKEKNQLQSNFVSYLFEDADSTIWIGYTNSNHGTEGFLALDRLDVNQLTIEPISKDIKLPFEMEQLYKIYSLPGSKYLYLATRDGQIYVYKGQNKFELFYQHDKKTAVIDFKEGRRYYWLICGEEVLALDKNKKIVQRQFLDATANFNRCNIIGERDEKSVWVLLHYLADNRKKSWIWNLEGANTNTHVLDAFMDTSRMAFHSNYIQQPQMKASVFYNRRQMAIFDKAGKMIYHHAVPGVYFGAFYIDKQENIWVETNTGGLCQFSYQKNRFQSYFKKQPIRAITYMSGDSVLLANSYVGILRHNLYDKEEKITAGLGLDLLKSSKRKSLFISSEYRLMEEYDLNTLKLKKVYALKEKDRSKAFAISGKEMSLNWALHEDKQGRVWLGTSSGLAYWDEGTDSLQMYWHLNAFEDLASAVVNHFYENEAGLWVATSLGLFLMDKEKGVLRQYAENAGKGFQLPHNYILHIHEDKAGVFWLSTRGGGIIKLVTETGTFEHFTTEQGLSHNVVYAILEDEQGHFWMSSDYGLMRFNPQTHLVNTYLPRDGILHEEFNHTSFYKAPDGQLYFGGVAGIIGFNPKDFLTKKARSIPLQIIKYQYFDGSQSQLVDHTQALVQKPEIVLNYTDRFFILDFALLDYSADQENQYAYKIEGLDDDWHYISNNSIRINGLGAGNYTLHVKGQGKDGIWSSSALNIPILVKQPFYLTWQFFLLLIISLLAYFRWRVLRFKKAQEKLEEEVKKRTEKIAEQANKLRELDNVKSRFFANISHELRTPLTLMLGPITAIIEKHYGEDAEKIISILEIAKRNGHQLQNLIEEILMLSKLEANNLELEEEAIAFYTFVQRVFMAFEAQAQLLGVDYQLNYNLDRDICLLLDANKFEKILNNLLSNALKHTPRGGCIALNLGQKELEENLFELHVEVIDSGRGIFPEDLPFIFDRFYQSKHKEAIVQGGTGIGLALAFEFSELLGGNLSVSSTLGAGSNFSLTIPVKVVEATERTVLEVDEWDEKEAIMEFPKSPKGTFSTLLIVEDNADMRHFISDLLAPYYNILTAENGKIGLDILEKESSSIDLILSDVMMPELDGFQMLEQIKQNDVWKQKPVIMLTARAAEQDKLYALRIGVDDYLQKPFSRQELLVRIQNLLENYRQRKTWQQTADLEEETTENTPEAEKDEWLENVERIAKREVGNSQFGITSLAYDLEMSERHLRRTIKAKTGLSPNQYFRLIKLDVARQYLEAKKYQTVAEVAKKIAFSNVNYFSKIYYQEYGKKPIEYLK